MRRDISLFSGTFEMAKGVWKLVVVALVIAGATCENELDFKLQLLYEAVDSALDKPLVNRLILSVLRIAAVGPKNKKIMNTCYANGNTDIHTMRVCFTDATGISVNGVCNKEGIAKYMDKRFRHMNNFIWEFAVDLMGCSCFKKASVVYHHHNIIKYTFSRGHHHRHRLSSLIRIQFSLSWLHNKTLPQVDFTATLQNCQSVCEVGE
ncbi:uncharacterized protein LOC144151787 [Haemaphysalis longicornis]